MPAHELRNPMSTIRSGLPVLDLTITDAMAPGTTVASTVAMMARQTDHLVRMVDDLLDVSRIGQGKIEQKTSGLTRWKSYVKPLNWYGLFTQTMLLKLKGYEAYTQNNGRSGLEAAERLRPAAILLAIGMPELDELPLVN